MNFLGIKMQATSTNNKSSLWNSIWSVGLTLSLSLAAVTILLSSTPAQAKQSSTLSAVYGRGVHAYFSGNSALAEQLFSQVIDSGSRDPRPYYFRGVLRMGMGRQYEAENDMRVGASFEASNPGAQHSIGRALQRVQGTNRKTLENFRRQGRLNHLQHSQQQSQQRYEHLKQRAPQVLRQPGSMSLTQPVQAPNITTGQPKLTPKNPTRGNPIPENPAPETTTNPLVQPADKMQPAVIEPELPAEVDPFDDAAEPAMETEGASDPFGDAFETEPVEETTAAEPTAEIMPPGTDADPFGSEITPPTEEIEEANPFGDSDLAPVKQPATPEPATESMPEESMSENTVKAPFGNETIPAEEMKESDPFGDEATPIEATEENDSFGAAPESTSPGASNMIGAGPGGPTMNPAGQLFYSLGQWLGSNAKKTAKQPAGFSNVRADLDMPSDEFELGPIEEMPPGDSAAEVDPFAEDPFGDDTVTEEVESIEEAASDEDDPFADDPFADN